MIGCVLSVIFRGVRLRVGKFKSVKFVLFGYMKFLPIMICFLWRSIFPFIFVIIFKMIFMSGNQAKISWKDYAWFPDIKIIFKIIANDKGKN